MIRPLIGTDGDLRVDAEGYAVISPESIEAVARRTVELLREMIGADRRNAEAMRLFEMAATPRITVPAPPKDPSP